MIALLVLPPPIVPCVTPSLRGLGSDTWHYGGWRDIFRCVLSLCMCSFVWTGRARGAHSVGLDGRFMQIHRMPWQEIYRCGYATSARLSLPQRGPRVPLTGRRGITTPVYFPLRLVPQIEDDSSLSRLTADRQGSL